MANAASLCKHMILSSFRNVNRMENSFDSIYSCSKITSVCRILISMSSELSMLKSKYFDHYF